MQKFLISLATAGLVIGAAQAAIQSTTSTGGGSFDFESQLSNTDLIAGVVATQLPDNGWLGVTPPEPARLIQLTDGTTGGGLNGLLNDFPGVGTPTKRIEYSLGGQDITGINILSGNDGADGRVFMSVAIYTDGNLLAYVESDPLGTVNNTGRRSTFVEIFDDAGQLASNVDKLQFDFYAVDNTQGQYRDAWDGVNPFTSVDDGLNAAISSPLIWEIDVLPEPTSLVLLSLAALAIRRR